MSAKVQMATVSQWHTEHDENWAQAISLQHTHSSVQLATQNVSRDSGRIFQVATLTETQAAFTIPVYL